MDWMNTPVAPSPLQAQAVTPKQQANQEFLAIVAKLWEAANVFKARGNGRRS